MYHQVRLRLQSTFLKPVLCIMKSLFPLLPHSIQIPASLIINDWTVNERHFGSFHHIPIHKHNLALVSPSFRFRFPNIVNRRSPGSRGGEGAGVCRTPQIKRKKGGGKRVVCYGGEERGL